MPSAPQRAFDARFDFTRRFSVNVIAMTCSIPSRNAPPSSAGPSMSAHAIRCVNVNVLPLPAPAETTAGHRRRDAFQLARFESVEIHAPTPFSVGTKSLDSTNMRPTEAGAASMRPATKRSRARPILSSVASSSEENSRPNSPRYTGVGAKPWNEDGLDAVVDGARSLRRRTAVRHTGPPPRRNRASA